MNKRDRREGRERGDICIHIVIPSVVQQKLAQHYKAIILEEKKKRLDVQAKKSKSKENGFHIEH